MRLSNKAVSPPSTSGGDMVSSQNMSYQTMLASEADILCGDRSNSEPIYCWNAGWELSEGASPPLAPSLSSAISPRVECTINPAPVLHMSPTTTFSANDLNNLEASVDSKLGELLAGIDYSPENDQQSCYGTGQRKRERQSSTSHRSNYFQSTAVSIDGSSNSERSTNERLLGILTCPEDVLVFDKMLKDPSTADHAVGCDCSTALNRSLSQAGDHLHQNSTGRDGVSSPPIDYLLICLDSGLRACEETLQCYNCNGTVGDGYLITTVVHHLGGIARQLAEALCPKRACQNEYCLRDHGGAKEYDHLDQSLEDFNVWAANLQQHDCHSDSIIIQEQVSVGSYTVKNSQSKVRFVCSAVLELFSRMRELLGRVKHKACHDRTAWNVVADSEY